MKKHYYLSMIAICCNIFAMENTYESSYIDTFTNIRNSNLYGQDDYLINTYPIMYDLAQANDPLKQV